MSESVKPGSPRSLRNIDIDNTNHAIKPTIITF
jgi:hypothetical protein